jgi:DNA-binding CsgD family transcriptional regulator
MSEALRSLDLRAALEFVDTAWALADAQAFMLQTLLAIVDAHPICSLQMAYAGFEAELEMGITHSRARTSNFVLDRVSGDFSDRDRAVLELVRPHLRRIHEMTDLRRAAGSSQLDDLSLLTPREGEILELVAAGMSNAAIAERLWISPGTVKKHLENIYAKLQVTNRTAAVTRFTAQRQRLK